MRSKKLMAPDVDIDELAAVTKNFSGAEIGGLVKSATSFAFNRHVKAGTTAGVADDVKDLKITRADFMSALDEVKPAFGVAEDELKSAIPNGIIPFAPKINEILENGKLFVEQVRSSQRTPLVSVLVHGPPSTGKTALAAEIAIRSEYPFIKLISPKQMVGMSDGQKIDFIRRSFENSYKSPLSVVVVDNIERIIEWVPIGARFSNPVLQALMVFFSNLPPKGHRLLILATTSNRAMVNEMDMADSFTADIRVPTIENVGSLMRVVDELQLFDSQEEAQEARRLLAAADQSARDAPAGTGPLVGYDGSIINIGVKKLLSVVEMSRQAQDRVATLVSHLTLNL